MRWARKLEQANQRLRLALEDIPGFQAELWDE